MCVLFLRLQKQYAQLLSFASEDTIKGKDKFETDYLVLFEQSTFPYLL